MSSRCHWFLLNGALITQKSWKFFHHLRLSVTPLTLANMGKSRSSEDFSHTLALLCLKFTLTALKNRTSRLETARCWRVAIQAENQRLTTTLIQRSENSFFKRKLMEQKLCDSCLIEKHPLLEKMKRWC